MTNRSAVGEPLPEVKWKSYLGRDFDGYQIKDLLGLGSFSAVYKAWQTRRHGQLAFVIRVVNKAAGIPVPRDIFRDLKDVCNHLQETRSR